MKILLAEDEPGLQKIIRMYLEKEGYSVTVAGNGREGLERLCEEAYDLAILDWMMPVMDGIALCREIRRLAMPVRVVMLTAKDSVEDEIAGLSCGADDYIKKPFEPKLLILRIRKLFRLEETLTCQDLVMNRQAQTVTLGGGEITLARKEYELLLMFMMNQGVILSREKLLDEIWGFDYEGDARTVDTHIRRLRSKIGDRFIFTHVGLGYSMRKDIL